MKINLGINTGFFVNRYPLHNEWMEIVKNEFKINHVQLTADMINPSLPDRIFFNEAEKILKLSKKNKINIQSTFTGAFTRVNHLAHPNKEIRNYWLNWFKKFIDLTSILEADSMGSHFGILSSKDAKNKRMFEIRKKQNIEGWVILSEYAKIKGLKFLSWEPMSIKREYGETINKCKQLQNEVNTNSHIPIKLCIDVDHGDISSKNKNNLDPYQWIKKLIKDIAYIHIKQSMNNKASHFPFTKENNKKGKIDAKKIIDILLNSNLKSMDLLLELSFKEREPFDDNVIKDVKESINYWKKNIKKSL